MKKIALIIGIISIISCQKGLDSVECDSKSSNSGIIISAIDFGSCIYTLKEHKIIIQDSLEYVSLQKEINKSIIGKDSCSFPHINFTENTLLGMYTQANGCSINFKRGVFVDSILKSTNYIITTEGCGNCENLLYNYNFVTTNKIDSTYSILFEGKLLP